MGILNDRLNKLLRGYLIPEFWFHLEHQCWSNLQKMEIPCLNARGETNVILSKSYLSISEENNKNTFLHYNSYV